MDELKPRTEFGSFLMTIAECNIERQIKSSSLCNIYLTSHRQASQCVMKQLSSRRLDQRRKDAFYREIELASRFKSHRIIQFIGYTMNPYSLLYEYAVNGSLHSILHKSVRELSATDKTLVMIGVAYSMREIHEKEIIHGDLTPWNILLDESLVPKVMLSGVSRRVSEEPRFIGQARPNYMAPEKLLRDVETKESDVFSYGVVLWELVTEKRAFHHMTTGQIRGFCEEDRCAEITDKARPAIVELVSSCLRLNPTERPTFAEIVEQVKRVDCVFQGADERVVQRFIGACEREEKFERKPEENMYNLCLKMLRSLPDDVYKDELERLLELPEGRKAFMRAAVTVMRTEESLIWAKNAALELMYVLWKHFADDFIELKLHEQLPFERKELIDHVLSVLIPVFEMRPEVATVEMIETVARYWQEAPMKVLRLMALVCQRFTDEYVKWDVVDSILCHAKALIDKGNLRECTLVLYYLTRLACFREERSRMCILIFRKCIDYSDIETMKVGYAVMRALQLSEVNNPAVLCRHFENPVLRPAVLRYLTVVKVDTVDPMIIQLLSQSHEKLLITAVLWRFAYSRRFVPTILQHADLTSMKPVDLTKLILIMMLKWENWSVLVNHEKLPNLLSIIIKSGDPKLLTIVSSIIRKWKISGQVLQRWEEAHMVEDYIEQALLINNDDVIVRCYLLIDHLIRVGVFLPSFLEFLPRIISDLEEKPEMQKWSLCLLIMFALFDTGLEAIRQQNIENIFKNITVQPENQSLVEELRSRIQGENGR